MSHFAAVHRPVHEPVPPWAAADPPDWTPGEFPFWGTASVAAEQLHKQYARADVVEMASDPLLVVDENSWVKCIPCNKYYGPGHLTAPPHVRKLVSFQQIWKTQGREWMKTNYRPIEAPHVTFVGGTFCSYASL